MQKNEFGRYVLNGVFATLIHYSVLNFNLFVLEFESAGYANFIAAMFGISASFLGSRYFVYKGHVNSLSSQLSRFIFLYASIALLHGSILYFWTDIYGFSYHIGFLVATGVQFFLSYFGNKILVFK